MTPRTWVILGASSIIAEQFAHCAAKAGNHLRLVGRDEAQLQIIAKDIEYRFKVPCEIMAMDLTKPVSELNKILKSDSHELDLLLAHSDFAGNEHLSAQSITQLIQVNIMATVQLIHAYLQHPQMQHHVLFLSSVAACRGRAKNSLYGASKAAVEVYLQGLQQSATKDQHITIARLGFIDTKQTFGLPGIFYAAPPKACAQACWSAVNKHKGMFYYPGFWRLIMAVMTRIPFFIYKKMKTI
ncbi:SDR family oxidoreductase [uncultured Legionella sp.]|uniref:SDR family NAD(P)-dependent oxidoreductase n=1 Tax=uncultured Legionella sp. TaxID=210934 RepID=UPI0026019266|nr:SDR family NAD(P)-dependent oxidoreductase [uncultured Legionella sp.]